MNGGPGYQRQERLAAAITALAKRATNRAEGVALADKLDAAIAKLKPPTTLAKVKARIAARSTKR